MRIIARRTLREFVEALAGHQDQPAVKAALDAWFDEVRKARWRNTADVKRSYAAASVVTADRIVFNVKNGASIIVGSDAAAVDVALDAASPLAVPVALRRSENGLVVEIGAGQYIPSGCGRRFRQGHRVDQVDRHAQGLRPDRCDRGGP